MLYNPDDYPTQPEEWYATKTGRIVGHVSLLRDMLNPTEEGLEAGESFPANMVPKIFFSIGKWVDCEWVESGYGGCGVLLDLREEDPMPIVTIGDFELFEPVPSDPSDSVIVDTLPLKELALDLLGPIYGGSAPVEYWTSSQFQELALRLDEC